MKAAKKATELEKSKLAKSTQRNHLTNFIRDMKSRQENVPLMGEFIDEAKCEPLHLKNNVEKELFIKILLVVFASSDLKGTKTFNEVKENTSLSIFCTFVKRDMNCNYLVKKLGTWYNECGGKLDKNFSFRFRGKESLTFLKYFSSLLIECITYSNGKKRLYQVFVQFFHLRHVISNITRIESFNSSLLQFLECHCDMLFKACIVFDLGKPSPSLWTICKAAPFHAKLTL